MSRHILTLKLQACKDVGFFYLENHGIPEETIREVFEQSKFFFGLPLEDKMSVLADKNNRGYTPMYEEMLDPSSQAKGDTKVQRTTASGFLSSCCYFYVLPMS